MTLTISALLILFKYAPNGLRSRVWDSSLAICICYFTFALLMLLDHLFVFGETLELPVYAMAVFAISIGAAQALDIKYVSEKPAQGLEEGALLFGLASTLEPSLVLLGLAALIFYWEWDYNLRRKQPPKSRAWPFLILVAALLSLGADWVYLSNQAVIISLLVATMTHFALLGSRIYMLAACAVLVY